MVQQTKESKGRITCFLEAPGLSFIPSTTSWCGQNKAHWRLASWSVSWVAIAQTVESLEYMSDPALAAWILL